MPVKYLQPELCQDWVPWDAIAASTGFACFIKKKSWHNFKSSLGEEMSSTNYSKPEAAPSEQRQGKALNLLCCTGFHLSWNGHWKLWGVPGSPCLGEPPGMHRAVQQCLIHVNPPVTGTNTVRKHCVNPSVPLGNRWDLQPIGFRI